MAMKSPAITALKDANGYHMSIALSRPVARGPSRGGGRLPSRNMQSTKYNIMTKIYSETNFFILNAKITTKEKKE